ncbi:MAG TPA: hypothetical protein VNQ33_02265 [Acidimicrobiales bacterium]|nr:hypothetical protein [Acidimicrobiales bacterium]
MFRRRSAPPVTGDTATVPPAAVSATQLDAAGWVLPGGIAAGQDGRAPAWTLVGTVGSPTATAVDPAGLVVGEAWSLDWWIGGDDRWYVPAREAAVRQDLVADAPIVETRARIPGGDAVHRAYGIRSARQTGDEWVVAEVENQTPVPLAAAFVIRPFMADSLGSVREITVEPVAGGAGRDVAHLVRVDGTPAVVLPRRPARIQAGNLAEGDVVDLVTTNEAGSELVTAACEAGMATMAFLFPVPHTALVRAMVPVGAVDPAEAVAYPVVAPDAEAVAGGWEIHRRGPRFEIPERRIAMAVERARTQVLLAHDGQAVRRDGAEEPDVEPGATDPILHAFDLLDKPDDVMNVVARWQERLADAPPGFDAIALGLLSTHWLLHRDDPLLDWMLPEVAAAVERLDRADRKGRLAYPADRARASAALRTASLVLAQRGQTSAALQVERLAARLAPGTAPEPASAADRLVAAATALAVGDLRAHDDLLRTIGEASSTGAWSGPGRHGRGIGHDLAASGAMIAAGRAMLVAERPDGLALLPAFPDSWYGNPVELHDQPTSFGVISFAIRWHGRRPALLWELVSHPGLGPVVLTVPGLDPTWSTAELRGDALLAEVDPPEGIDLVREVAEHPGLQEHMRPEGDEPEAPGPRLLDGGTFS